MQDKIKQWSNYSLSALCTSGVISGVAPSQVVRTKTSEQVVRIAMIADAMVGELAGK